MESRLAVTPKDLASFCRQNQIRALSLFGSATTGNLTDESDIDLLVEFEPVYEFAA